MKQSRARNAKEFQRSTRSFLVKGFVVLSLVAITLFSLPLDSFPFPALRRFLAPGMRCFGLSEMWDMFAPNPRSAEQYLKAIVVTQKGETTIYSLPRMEDLSFFDRYRKERYRRLTESVLCNICGGLWPDIEREVARRSMNPADPPVRVTLIKYESPIDPKTGATGDDAHATSTVLSELSIAPEDLQ